MTLKSFFRFAHYKDIIPSYYLKYFNDVLLHMIFEILIGIIFLALFYMHRIKEPKNMQQNSFISSDSFIGAKKGYVFKMDSKGLGYYLDN